MHVFRPLIKRLEKFKKRIGIKLLEELRTQGAMQICKDMVLVFVFKSAVAKATTIQSKAVVMLLLIYVLLLLQLFVDMCIVLALLFRTV